MDSDLETVTISIDDSIAWVTIDRPEKLNALSLQTIEDLLTALDRLESADDVRVLAVRGSGERAFSAGADLSEFAARTAAEQLHYNRRLADLCDRFESAAIPSIAGVNGVAFGGGAELLLTCDICVASTEASFSEAEINVGVTPFAKRLIDTVGYGTAADLCLTGRTVDAEECRQLGLFNRVVEPEELDAEIERVADTLIEKTAESIRLTKQTLVAARDNDMAEAMDHQILNFHDAFETDETQERIQAFLDRQ